MNIKRIIREEIDSDWDFIENVNPLGGERYKINVSNLTTTAKGVFLRVLMNVGYKFFNGVKWDNEGVVKNIGTIIINQDGFSFKEYVMVYQPDNEDSRWFFDKMPYEELSVVEVLKGIGSPVAKWFESGDIW